MRATKGYVAGVGTTGALVGAIGCAFAVLSTVVAVQGWPLGLAAPGVATFEGRAPDLGDAFAPSGVFPVAISARTPASVGSQASRTAARVRPDGGAPDDG